MIGITIDAIAVGDCAQITRRVTDGDIAARRREHMPPDKVARRRSGR